MELRITLALAVSLSAFAANAQQPPPAAAPPPAQGQAGGKVPVWRQVCAAEIDKFCKEADKANKTVDCLAQHENDLSEECTTKFMRGYRVSQVCKADFERLCKDAPALGQCVKEHDKDLSKECRAALVKGSKQQKAEEKAEAKAEKAEEKTAKTAAKPAKAAKKAAKKKE
jgi:hypothetical protein